MSALLGPMVDWPRKREASALVGVDGAVGTTGGGGRRGSAAAGAGAAAARGERDQQCRDGCAHSASRQRVTREVDVLESVQRRPLDDARDWRASTLQHGRATRASVTPS